MMWVSGQILQVPSLLGETYTGQYFKDPNFSGTKVENNLASAVKKVINFKFILERLVSLQGLQSANYLHRQMVNIGEKHVDF